MARQLHPSSIAEARQSLSAMERNPRAVNRAGHTGIRSARNYLDRAEQAHAAGNTTEAAQHYASAQRAIRQIPDPDMTRREAAWAHTTASRATEARALEQERQQRIAHDFAPAQAMARQLHPSAARRGPAADVRQARAAIERRLTGRSEAQVRLDRLSGDAGDATYAARDGRITHAQAAQLHRAAAAEARAQGRAGMAESHEADAEHHETQHQLLAGTRIEHADRALDAEPTRDRPSAESRQRALRSMQMEARAIGHERAVATPARAVAAPTSVAAQHEALAVHHESRGEHALASSHYAAADDAHSRAGDHEAARRAERNAIRLENMPGVAAQVPRDALQRAEARRAAAYPASGAASRPARTPRSAGRVEHMGDYAIHTDLSGAHTVIHTPTGARVGRAEGMSRGDAEWAIELHSAAARRPKAITQTQHGTATTHTPHDRAMHQAVQRGAKGGTFVLTKSGKKRYVKKA